MNTDNLIKNFANNNNLNDNLNDNIVSNIIDNDVAVDSTDMTESMNEVLLDEFKKDVQDWMSLDNQMKRLEVAVKERRKKKKDLNLKILDFMDRFNIEDLNTKEGIIRYKKSFVKEPLSQKKIKDKLMDMFKDDNAISEKVEKIFTDRGKVEKTTLRRINI
jgi:hypothetical protein|tara:strand:- start:572 stop:1054 length:483 start_codon:yes stop_codon:yes gene_type:complete